MLQTSQNLETLDLRDERTFKFDLVSWICCTHSDILLVRCVLGFAPFDLGRFPALRHVKIHLPTMLVENEMRCQALDHLLSISSSTSAIETLEIKLNWNDEEDEYGPHGKYLFLPDTWSTLDETLTCEKFVSLRKVVLDLYVETASIDDKEHQNLSLPYIQVGTLFPMFRALLDTQCTLEINMKFISI